MFRVIHIITATTLLTACATHYQSTIDGPSAKLKTFYQGKIFTNQDNCSKGEYFNYAGNIFHPEIIDIPANQINTFWFIGTSPYGNKICQLIIEFYADQGEIYTPVFQPLAVAKRSYQQPCTMVILNDNNQPITYNTRQLRPFHWGHNSPYCYPEIGKLSQKVVKQ